MYTLYYIIIVVMYINLYARRNEITVDNYNL